MAEAEDKKTEKRWKNAKDYRDLIVANRSFGRRTWIGWRKWDPEQNPVVAAAYFQHRFMRNFRDLIGEEAHPDIAKKVGMKKAMLSSIMNGTAASMQQYMAIVTAYGAELLPDTSPNKLYPPPEIVDKGTREPSDEERSYIESGQPPAPNAPKRIETVNGLQVIVYKDANGRIGELVAVVSDWYPGQAFAVPED